MTNFLQKTLILLTVVFLLMPLTPVQAQSIGFGGENGGTINIIASTGFYNTDVAYDTFLDTTLGQLIAIFLGFLGALFLALIIYSGFQWMTAGGNEEKVENAKKRVLNASLGIGLIFFAYIITNIVFNFINQQGGVNQAPQANELNECEVDADCDAFHPKCEAFITRQGEQKLCTCFDGRGPACPNGYHCDENLIDPTARNSCVAD